MIERKIAGVYYKIFQSVEEFKSKYPNDVDVAVPYVAPLINGLEDPRTNDLINSNKIKVMSSLVSIRSTKSKLDYTVNR